MENEKDKLLDKIFRLIFNPDGFTIIVCFIIAPLMGVITEKEYVGIVIFCIGLLGRFVHHIVNITKK